MYYSPRIDPPESLEIGYCAHCVGEIYAGDEVAVLKSRWGFVHESCANEYARETLYGSIGIIDVNLTID